jgi:Mg2+/Co2+ transporter CorB
MPIYRSRVDDVVGIVHVFDQLQAAAPKADGRRRTVADLAHPAELRAGTMKPATSSVQLQAEQQHLAIVVDEYGGAVGIVTIEDCSRSSSATSRTSTTSSRLRSVPSARRVAGRGSHAVARLNAELELGPARERRLRDGRRAY